MNEEIHLNLECTLKSLADAEREIGELKMVVGLMLAKLPTNEREAVINELRSWGFPEKANEFDQFVHPRPAR
ncbi:hypothetical protein SJ090_12145 [Enterobacter cloacae]|nr:MULTISPECIES: hypothetical protein [Enterobacter]MDQ7215631.1 hypothetical protein [Enterobacter cloacae]MDX7022008.1 hypothetical protein [Enterobacter cloacae]MEA5204781.1 hypothetical protein [Enterobacter mori]